jgi:hypothetical protein
MANFFRMRLSVLSALMGAVLITHVADSASAQVIKRFKITGAGVAEEGFPLPGQPSRSHWSVGQATHLGRYQGQGTVDNFSLQPTDPTNPATPGIVATGTFGSGDPFVFTAANGDLLATYFGRVDKGASVPGEYEIRIVGFLPNNAPIFQAFWIAEFVAQPDESTGRFAGVTGSWIMYAKSAPFTSIDPEVGIPGPLGYSWQGEGWLTFLKP